VKLLADECCDAQLVEALRQDGHDVLYVLESMRGAVDVDILAKAFGEDRVLLTEDKDFGELVYRQCQPASGIILLRFEPHEDAQKLPRLQALISQHANSLLGAFVVLEVNKVRIRSLLV
jgi:predicted nuclease of predicted toxin-antitoxin system